MKNADFKKSICLIAKKICNTESKILLKTSLNDLAFDSLNFVAFIVEIEDSFDIEFDGDELRLRKYKTIKDICQLCENKIEKKNRKESKNEK